MQSCRSDSMYEVCSVGSQIGLVVFFFQAEDGIRDYDVTGVQTCALPICYRTTFDVTLPLDGTSWVAVRCYEQRPGGRERFAHTAPVHFDVPGKPLHPRRAAIEYLIGRMKEELARSKKTLRPDELEEYRQALRVYEKIAADGVR